MPNTGTSDSLLPISNNLSPNLFLLPSPHCSNPDQAYSIEVSGHLASSLSFLRSSLTFSPPLNHHPAHRSLTASHCLLFKLCRMLHRTFRSRPCHSFLIHHSPTFSMCLSGSSEKTEPTLCVSTERENLLRGMVKQVL